MDKSADVAKSAILFKVKKTPYKMDSAQEAARDVLVNEMAARVEGLVPQY